MNKWQIQFLRLVLMGLLGLLVFGKPVKAEPLMDPGQFQTNNAQPFLFYRNSDGTFAKREFPSSLSRSPTACSLPAPTLTSPINGIQVNTLVPRFEWSGAGTDKYKIQVSINSDFSAPTIDTFLSGLSNASVSVFWYRNLSPNTNYYWRVATACADYSIGAYSPTATFRTGNITGPFLPAPSIYSPTEGAVLPSLTLSVSWERVAGSVGCQVRLYRTYSEAQSDGNPYTVWSGSANSYCDGMGFQLFSPFNVNGKYYYRVLIRDDSAWGSLSPVRSFIVPPNLIYSISGRVTDAKKSPISGVTVYDNFGNVTSTDASGNYRLSGLGLGNYTIRTFKGGFTSPTRSVTLPPDATNQDFTIIKNVVVLVHGWGGPSFFPGKTDTCQSVADHATDINNLPLSANNFGVFVRNLVQNQWDVWIAHLDTAPGQTPIIEQNADCLRKQILDIRQKTGVDKVVLIGHSMGGLVSRGYIENRVNGIYKGDVSKLITLGSPHVGTTGGVLFCSSTDPAACQFSPLAIGYFNETHTQRAPGVNYYLIGGNRTPGNLGGFLFLTDGYNDGAVGAESAIGREYRGSFPPIEKIVGSYNGQVTRYVLGASHVSNAVFGILAPAWFPSYFNNWPWDNTTATSTYQCVQQILGISGGNCPSQITSPVQLRRPNSFVVSKTPTFSGNVTSGQILTYTVPIDTVGQSEFNLTWITGTIGLVLTNPLGTTIDPTYAATHPSEVAYLANTTDPDNQLYATYSFTSTLSGTYTVTITAGDIGSSGTNYTSFALVDSPRTIGVSTDKSLYAIGNVATITTTMQNSGVGLSGATVQAKVFRSDGIIDILNLSSLGAGIYGTTYTIPNAPGFLRVSVIAQGNDAGTLYARQGDTLIAVSPTTIQLNGQYSDTASDTDGNGKFDDLNIIIGLNSNQAGKYMVSGDLVGSGNALVAHGVISVTLGIGMTSTTLPFNGDDIRQSGLNGSYKLTNLTILDQQNGGVPVVWKAMDVYTTKSYNFANFATTCFSLVINPTTGGRITPNLAPNCNGGTQYASGTVLTLQPIPNPGYRFIRWGGDLDGFSGPKTITLNADTIVAADFTPPDIYLPFVTK